MSWRWVVPRWLRHGLLWFGALLAVEYVVVPVLVGAGKNLHLLSNLTIGWLLAGLALEGASVCCYALLTRTLLPGTTPTVSRLVRIVMATTALSHVVPAGAASGTGLGFQLLTAEGVAATDAGFAIATAALGSAVVLNVLLLLALLGSIPLAGLHPAYVTFALVSLLALLGTSALLYAFAQGEDRAVRVVRTVGQRLPRVGADRLEHVFRQLSDAVRELTRDRSRLQSALRWASLNWLLDAATLWSFLAALGYTADPFTLFVAYGIANILAAIPITPGGLGVVEATAVTALVSFGATNNVATLGVLGWRLVNFWLPIPTGAACYLSLRLPRGSRLRVGHRAFPRMAADAQLTPGPEAPAKPPTAGTAGTIRGAGTH